METYKLITDVNQINSGDVLLVHGHSLLAKEVQHEQKYVYAEAGEYNHFAEFVWINNILMVSEALINGIRLSYFAHYIKKQQEDKNILLCLKPDFKTDF